MQIVYKLAYLGEILSETNYPHNMGFSNATLNEHDALGRTK